MYECNHHNTHTTYTHNIQHTHTTYTQRRAGSREQTREGVYEYNIINSNNNDDDEDNDDDVE